MITYKTGKLMAFKEHYPAFADAAFDAAERDRDDVIRGLTMFAARGMDCVITYDDDAIVGYMLFGPIEKLLQWPTQMPLLLHLRSLGVKEMYASTHLHLRKKYWRTGTQLGMTRAMAAEALANGVKHALLWWITSDKMVTWSLSQPGSTKLEGFVAPNGRPVGLRDLAVFLGETAPVS
jgi:hypothetical protein